VLNYAPLFKLEILPGLHTLAVNHYEKALQLVDEGKGDKASRPLAINPNLHLNLLLGYCICRSTSGIQSLTNLYNYRSCASGRKPLSEVAFYLS